jgi:ribonuclease J
VLVMIDKKTGQLAEPPEIISRGFVYLRDATWLIEMSQQLIAEIIRNHTKGNLTNAIQDALAKMYYNETKRRPMTFAFVREIEGELVLQ